MELNGKTVPKDFLELIALNRNLYPCDFDPAAHLEIIPATDTRTEMFNIPVGIKRLWFYSYLAKNGKTGKILPYATVDHTACFVLADCEVWLDGELVAKAQVGQHFDPSQINQIDSVVQLATGLAQSKALTNAGFGIIPSTAPEIPNMSGGDGTNMPVPSANPSPMGELPYVFGNEIPAQNSFAGTQPPAPVNVQSQPVTNDPVAAASQVIYNRNGQFKGLRMGEILASNPRQIIFLAEKYPKGTPDVDAARTLYPAACKAMGVPCKNLA